MYRPVLAEGCAAGRSCLGLGSGGGLPLPGFGVELAIKNMEYSALDDSKVPPLSFESTIYSAAACPAIHVHERFLGHYSEGII